MRHRLGYWAGRGLGCSQAAEGVWRRWYVNGQLAEEVTLVAGARHGPFRSWCATGQMEQEGEWRDGKPHGRWRSWRADGALVREVVYEGGVVVESRRGM